MNTRGWTVTAGSLRPCPADTTAWTRRRRCAAAGPAVGVDTQVGGPRGQFLAWLTVNGTRPLWLAGCGDARSFVASRLVLPAVSFENLLARSPAFGTPTEPLGHRLVSVIFAHPGSAVWRDLSANRAFLDRRSGESWDLFFAGMSGYAPMSDEPDPVEVGRMPEGGAKWFNPSYFSRVEHAVADGHARVVGGGSWRYSGATDLVSFMVYGRRPDWASLRSVRLDRDVPLSLGEVTEGVRRWDEDRLDARLAPGEAGPPPVASATLPSAMTWTAGVVVGGSLGNAGYELLKRLLSG